MATFGPRELYGGAIQVEIPNSFLDGSDLRQLPSHQELFLSTTTLTSAIFEINQYEDVQPTDAAAATYHFTDVIDSDDHLLHDLPPPQQISMKSKSLSKYSAYILTGTVVSEEKPKATTSPLPPDWQQTPEMVKVYTVICQLVVRLKDQGTDFCLRVNVPLKEFEGEAGRAEVQFGQDIVNRVMESLDVKDFGLFDG